MKIYTVSFFGHGQIDNLLQIENSLRIVISDLIKSKEYIDFLIGRDGEFDQIAAGVIRRVCQELDYGNTHLTLVLPYMTAEYRDNEDYYLKAYDEVEICQKSANAHFKAAIQLRNRSIIDRSDLVICYVCKNSGGAYKAMQYAKRKQVKIIDLNSAK